MKRSVRTREERLIDAALAKAVGYGFALEQLAPGFRESVTVEVMNRHFTKYHLGRGFALHRFSGVDLSPQHDHPCSFTTLILEPYVEEIYVAHPVGWTCDRESGSSNAVSASAIHKIVELPNGESWTLAKYGRHGRVARFYRFSDVVESRTSR